MQIISDICNVDETPHCSFCESMQSPRLETSGKPAALEFLHASKPPRGGCDCLKKESSETTNIIKYLQICKSQIDIQCNLRITAAFLQVLQRHTTIYNLYSNLVQHPGCYIDSLLARFTSTWRYLFKVYQDMSRYVQRVLIHRAILNHQVSF